MMCLAPQECMAPLNEPLVLAFRLPEPFQVPARTAKRPSPL